MAYADNRRTRFSPASVSAAVIVNGLFFAVLVLEVPEIIGVKPDKPIVIIDTSTPPPPAVPEKRVKQTPDKATTVAEKFDRVMIAPLSDNPVIPQIDEGFTLPPTPPLDMGEIRTPPAPPTPIEIGAKVNPRYAKDLQPAYPLGMLRMNIEGAVTVRVQIGTDGRVKDVQPIRTSEEDFLKATREQALRKWRFTPATRDGVPVESWREMTVRFQMPT